MPVYRFEGMVASGSEVKGQIDAADKDKAIRKLRAKGYFITRLEIAGDEAAQSESCDKGRKTMCRDYSSTVNDDTSSRSQLWFLLGVVLLIVACVFINHVAVQPLRMVLQASDWVETSCTVISSELKEHRAEEESTYSIKIVYEYEFRSSHYQSDRYDFSKIHSSRSLAKRRNVVKACPPGSQAVCFVNPAKPAEAVMERGWTSEMWWGMLPIPFVLIGVLVVLHTAGILRFKTERKGARPYAPLNRKIDL